MHRSAGLLTNPAGLADERGLPAMIVASFFRHRAIHAIALFTLALGFVVGSHTGNMPDLGLLREYSFYMFAYLWIGGSGYAAFRLAWLAFVDKSPSPGHALLGSIRQLLADRNRLANTINGLAAIIAFLSGFAVLKGAIAVIAPFSWDETLAQFSRNLHFGKAPFEWLWWLVQSPLAIHVLNFFYNFWFFVLLAALFTSIATRRDTVLRHQFLLSFMLIWLIGGFFIATAFSSAGPCYYARLGLGDYYQPLIDALQSANRHHSIWALSTQDRLWSGYIGTSSGSMGISAFPSMHVATSVLFALYAMRLSRWLGVVMWLFAATIMVGSVVLGWHYGIDGYAGGLISLIVWKAAGRFLSWPNAWPAGETGILSQLAPSNPGNYGKLQQSEVSVSV